MMESWNSNPPISDVKFSTLSRSVLIIVPATDVGNGPYWLEEKDVPLHVIR